MELLFKNARYVKLIFVMIWKYTWAPQTVHNTPVMNILKGFLYNAFLKESH